MYRSVALFRLEQLCISFNLTMGFTFKGWGLSWVFFWDVFTGYKRGLSFSLTHAGATSDRLKACQILSTTCGRAPTDARAQPPYCILFLLIILYSHLGLIEIIYYLSGNILVDFAPGTRGIPVSYTHLDVYKRQGLQMLRR